MTTQSKIAAWFDDGVKQGKTYMVVVVDTFDWEDYPVYAADEADCQKQFDLHNGQNMQRVMEVYDLQKDKATQLAEKQAWHLPG